MPDTETIDPDAGWDDDELIAFMADRPPAEQATPPDDAGEPTTEVPPLGEGDTDPDDPDDDEDGDA